MTQPKLEFSCIILAGGEGKRTGGADKGLIVYKEQPLIEHVIDAVKNQVDDIVISANRNTNNYKQYSTMVISDDASNYRGPLAGIAACLKHCKHERVLVVACDMPDLPRNLVSQLFNDMHDKAVSIATVDKYHQLAFIVNKNCSRSIQLCLDNNQLKLILWVKSVSHNMVNFDDNPDAFKNLNHLSH